MIDDLRTIICADWSKTPRGRAVYVADVETRTIARRIGHWTLKSVLRLADDCSGPALVAFDLPLGVPASFLRAAGRESFTSLLQAVGSTFFEPIAHAAQWTVKRPFFSVPRGCGSLTAFVEAARAQAIDLRRDIEIRTGAKSVFVKSGIPGSVGCAAISLWSELAIELLQPVRDFRLWPFESNEQSITVAEIYPRAAYATALRDAPYRRLRSRLSIAKTSPGVRHAAIDDLIEQAWIRRERVVLRDLDAARAGEDDFDACMTTAALLRCVVESLPLHAPVGDGMAEGGILGTGTVNLDEPGTAFRPRVA